MGLTTHRKKIVMKQKKLIFLGCLIASTLTLNAEIKDFRIRITRDDVNAGQMVLKRIKKGFNFAINNCAYASVDCTFDAFKNTCNQDCNLQQEPVGKTWKRPPTLLSSFLCGITKEIIIKALWEIKGYEKYALAAHLIMQNYTPLLEFKKQEISGKACMLTVLTKTFFPLFILGLKKQTIGTI